MVIRNKNGLGAGASPGADSGTGTVGRAVFEKAGAEFRKFALAVEKSSDLVVLMDSAGTIEFVNERFVQVTGYSKDEMTGKSHDFLCPEGGGAAQGDMLSAGGWTGTVLSRKKDGGSFWSRSSVYPVESASGEITHYVSVSEDVTQKTVSGERLQYVTRHDGTTGLANRDWFIKRLNEWIGAAGAGGSSGALLLLDLDQFKFVSDSFGHGMGDELLRRVGKLLQVMLRHLSARYLKEPLDDGLLSRLSGDEFAVFLPSAGKVEGALIAEELRKGIEDFYQSDAQCHLTASIGVSFYPEHGGATAELLTRADSAMYRAKELGRNRFHFYTPEEHEIERMHLRLQRKEEILRALKEDRFEPWYQPILDLKDGGVTHYEVLARMRDREGNVVLPGPFIDIAERFGLVGSIARVISEKALRMQSQMKKMGYPLTFCINVSGKELVDREFLYFLQSKIYENGADPQTVIIEITETASIEDLDRALVFINTLKSMGCRVSLDDFGIGFTSFLYLKQMSVDYVKIAGSFVKNLMQNMNDRLFVKAMGEVAAGMGIKTIAEFVESDELIPLLRSYGMDYAQGYAIGRPAPAPDYKGSIRGVFPR